MTDDKADWDYKPDGQTKTEPPKLGSRGTRPPASRTVAAESISWDASEYLEHRRGTSWYMMLIALTALLSGAVYLITKDYFGSAIIVIAAVAVLIFSLQKPRKVTYNLDSEGLRINDKLYQYDHFKSFAVVREGDASSISLLSIKRFLPPISLYFQAEQEAQIVQVLGQYLPYENRNLDGVERLSRRLRF